MKLFTPTLLLALSALGVDAVGVNDSPYKTARLVVSTIQSAVQTAEDMDTGNYKDLAKIKDQLRTQFQGSMDGLRDWAYLVDNGYGYYGGDQQGQQECDHETKLYDQISQSIIGITPTFKNILNSKFKNEYAHIGLTEHRLQVTWGRNQKEAKLARLLGDKCPDNKDKLLKVQERGANSLKEMYDEVSRIANEDDGDDE